MCVRTNPLPPVRRSGDRRPRELGAELLSASRSSVQRAATANMASELPNAS
jgi:hypothetical protein